MICVMLMMVSMFLDKGVCYSDNKRCHDKRIKVTKRYLGKIAVCDPKD